MQSSLSQEGFSVARAIPWGFAMQDEGAAPNWIHRAPRHINQKAVRGCVFYMHDDKSVQHILGEHPSQSANWRDNEVHLPGSGKTIFFGTRPSAIAVPWSADRRAVFFNREFTQRPNTPLSAVSRVPHGRLKATPPVGFGVGEFKVPSLRVILDLDEAGHCPLNWMADVVVKMIVAIVPTGIDPCVKGIFVITPIMVEGDAVLRGYPAIVVLYNVSLLQRKKDKRFAQGVSPMKMLGLQLVGRDMLGENRRRVVCDAGVQITLI